MFDAVTCSHQPDAVAADTLPGYTDDHLIQPIYYWLASIVCSCYIITIQSYSRAGLHIRNSGQDLGAAADRVQNEFCWLNRRLGPVPGSKNTPLVQCHIPLKSNPVLRETRIGINVMSGSG